MYFDKSIKKDDFRLKIVFLGKAEIGKTILYKKIELYNDYKQFKILNKTYIPTYGYDFMIIGKKFNGKTYKLQIFDFSGQERFKTILYGHYKNASFILIFYDALDKDSFEEAKKYCKKAKEMNQNAIYFLIRNKYDLSLNPKKNKIVSDEEALEFADKNNLIFTHISSFENYGNGIDNLFDLILKEYNLNIRYNKNNENDGNNEMQKKKLY